jgi:surface protein
MDCLTMVLVERQTGLPLDIVIFINKFLSENLTDENFGEAIALWFEDEKRCQLRFGHLSFWNTSRVTNMVCAFYNRESFNEDISCWDVSNVTEMSYMFSETKFNGDLSSWNVSKVTDMSSMFYQATQFNGDLSQWDVRNVTLMSFMFCGASEFNGDLSRWDVSNVIDMTWMFYRSARFNGDLCPWEVAAGRLSM